MSKRLSIFFVCFLFLLTTDSFSSRFSDRFGLSLSPGGLFALGGSYSDTLKLKDIVNIGVGLGVSLRFELNDNVYFDFGYRPNWLSIKKENKPFEYKEKNPALMMSMFYMNGLFYLKSGYVAEPYLSFGVSVSKWRFSDNGLFGKPWPAPAKYSEDFSGTSLGLNVALGFEVYAFSLFTLFAEVRYYYVFTRDVPKFGTDDFTQQDFLGINIGITFYFKRK